MSKSSKTIFESFSNITSISSQKIAIEIDEQTWTYGELLTRSLNVAERLKIHRGDVVFQCVESSFEMICGLFGIFYAGGVCLSLNSTDSFEQLRQLIDEVPSRYILVHKKTEKKISSIIKDSISMIYLDDVSTEKTIEQNVDVTDDDRSFLLYEFDTMNRLKIIVHTYKSLRTGIENLMLIDKSHGDLVLQTQGTLFEILFPLINSSADTLVLLSTENLSDPNHLCRTIREKNINILFLHPNFVDKFNENVENLRTIFSFGSDELQTKQYLSQIKSLCPSTRIYSIINTNETNETIAYEILDDNDARILSLGSSLPFYECLLIEKNKERRIITSVDTKSFGYLCLTVSGLFQCYLNDLQSTDQAHLRIGEKLFFKTEIIARHTSEGLLVRVEQMQNCNDDKIIESLQSSPSSLRRSTLDVNLDESIRQKEAEEAEEEETINYQFDPRLQRPSHLRNPDITEESEVTETHRFLKIENKQEEEDQQSTRALTFPGFIEKSLFCLNQTTPIRKQCLQLITWPWFGRITIFIILLNCVTLALFQPCEKQCNTVRCLWVTIADHCIFAFFAIEMCIKMIAMGVFGKGTYLADAWNRLDCFIVITGSDLIMGDHLSLSIIRTIRVLRPLRAVHRIPSMRILVMLLIDTLPALGNLLLLCFFIFSIFGIIGVQLWKGLLRNRCFSQLNTTMIHRFSSYDDFPVHPFYVPPDEEPFICSDASSHGMNTCSDIPTLSRNNVTCGLDSTSACINWNHYYRFCSASDENPFSGSIHFDDIGHAWLAIFQIITLEGWSSIMYYVQDAHSFWDWMYFIVLIVIGSFFMMNLCLVIISAQFSETKKRETERMLAEQQRLSISSRSMSSSSELHGSCWAVMFTLMIKSMKKLLGRLCRFQDGNGNDSEKRKSKSQRSDPQSGFSSLVKIQALVRKLVISPYFDRLIFAAIIINTCSMAIEYHGEPSWLTNTIEYTNYVFVVIFTIEMVLKIIAFGFVKYAKSVFNLFDAMIVIVSWIEIFGASKSGLSVLRTFRLLRVVKMMQFFPELRRQCVIMAKTLDNVGTFLLFLTLFMFIFSVLGMHLFGSKFNSLQAFNRTSHQKMTMDCECCTCPEHDQWKNATELDNVQCVEERANFDTFLSSLLTVFQILTQEDWNEVLYNGMEKSGSWSAVYFIALMIFGNYVLLNLVVAIIVEEVSTQNESDNQPVDINGILSNIIMIPERQERVTEESHPCCSKRADYSLYLFSPTNKFRQLLQKLVSTKSFDFFILFFICFNCITIAMERPSIPPTSFERRFLTYTNYMFTVIFTIEMMLKVIANGFVIGQHTYLRNGWNVMDGFLVFVSIIDLIIMTQTETSGSSNESDATSHILGMLRVLRLLRALRPLRVINRAPGLKLVVETLLSSVKSIGNIVVICSVVFVIFGILGVQLFKGKFYYCDGPQADEVKTREECEALSGHQWLNQRYNFDHIGQALLTLFIVSSKDGWVVIMYHGIDAVDVDRQPIENHSPEKSIYFIVFLLIASFFVLNMFVGVVVDSFQNCQEEFEQEQEQRRREQLEQQRADRKQVRDDLAIYSQYPRWRQQIHDVCINKYFDLIIAAVIVINVATMSLEYYRMPRTLEIFLEYSNYFFTLVFIVEFLLKILALGPKRYFQDKWNVLDALIVIFSVAGIVIDKVSSKDTIPINPTLIRVIRILRIARVLKLLKMAKGIQTLLDTILQALPQIGNLGLLFFLLLFIFGALGVELFGRIKCDDDHPCSGLSKHANFENFGSALLTLFRIVTGDNWNGIMKDTLSSHGEKEYIMSLISTVYFVGFVVIAQFVLLNIIVAVLMKNLEDSKNSADDDMTDISDDLVQAKLTNVVESEVKDEKSVSNILTSF